MICVRNWKCLLMAEISRPACYDQTVRFTKHNIPDGHQRNQCLRFSRETRNKDLT